MLYQCHLSNGLMSGSHGDHILVKWSQLTRCLLGEWLQGKGSGYKGNGYKGSGYKGSGSRDGEWLQGEWSCHVLFIPW